MSLLSDATFKCCEKVTENSPLEMDVDTKIWAAFVQKASKPRVRANGLASTRLTLSGRLFEKVRRGKQVGDAMEVQCLASAFDSILPKEQSINLPPNDQNRTRHQQGDLWQRRSRVRSPFAD